MKAKFTGEVELPEIALSKELSERLDKLEEIASRPVIIQKGSDIHADIKDSDVFTLDGSYDENLYRCARDLEIMLDEKKCKAHADRIIYKIIEKYDIVKGLSDDSYKQLIRELSSLAHTSDYYDYAVIRKKYGLPPMLNGEVEF